MNLRYSRGASIHGVVFILPDNYFRELAAPCHKALDNPAAMCYSNNTFFSPHLFDLGPWHLKDPLQSLIGT
jgi:hypothetical protein